MTLKVRPRIRRRAERVRSGRVCYDAVLLIANLGRVVHVRVGGPVLVTVGGMESSVTVHPLFLESVFC